MYMTGPSVIANTLWQQLLCVIANMTMTAYLNNYVSVCKDSRSVFELNKRWGAGSGGGKTDGGPVVKATLPPQSLLMWAQPWPPLCPSPTRFTTPRGAPWHPTAWQLFFGSCPLLNPASPHLTPERGGQRSSSHLKLLSRTVANISTPLTSRIL